jgi:tetratricopeptide (TPR) repeat protein
MAWLEAAPADHPDRAVYLCNLAVALQARFERTGTLADLDAAVGHLRAAVAVTPADHPNRTLYLSNLGNALRARFQRTGGPEDLNGAIEAGQAAVAAAPAGDPHLGMYLVNLGVALSIQFGRTGDLADLDAAIGHLRAAVAVTPADHPNRAGCLANLGNALRIRFQRTGDREDLGAAIGNLGAAVAATPADHPDRASCLSYLGIALQTRFNRVGALADLDAAIGNLGEAVAVIQVNHPDRAIHLSNLGNAQRTRFERTGGLEDLSAAIGNLEAAVAAVPADHPNRAVYLSNLGYALYARFRRTGVLDDLDAAIGQLRAVMTVIQADHPDRARHLSNLGQALQVRFEEIGDREDMDAAIANHEAAVAAAPADLPERAVYLSNLGIALNDRFGRTGDLADLDAAIGHLQAAVDVSPADHPSLARRLCGLAIALRTRFERTGIQADRAAALSAYTRAAELGSAEPSIRIPAAHAGASLAAQSEPALAADLMEMAVRLLSEVAPRQLQRSDQQYALGGFHGLASDAAALVLADASAGDRRVVRALALLEAGRAVLLSQALDTRSDLTDLRQQHPGVATRFAELRERLDQPADSPAVSSLQDGTGAGAPSGQPAGDRRKLAGELAAILAQIRSLPGFTSFGCPPTASDLLSEADPGPIVTFSISAYRSDALLLTGNRITSVQLPGLVLDTLTEQIGLFYDALNATADLGASFPERRDAQARLSGVLEWLWDTAAGPVLHALGYDRQPSPGSPWPRMWWAPGGLLGLLPLHAAGYHRDASRDPGQRAVMDRVISSYTPTVRALGYARQHLSAPETASRSLIVAMPVTPGLPGGGELPNVPDEVGRVRHLLPNPVLLVEPGATEDLARGSSGVPTKANVIAHLPGCSIAHFACHGASDPSDPSRSLLLLHDHNRDPLTVASLAPVNLARAQLAYLSACRTAVISAVRLLDEAIHLTTAFQLAGFPHVIGTLWEISDKVAADVAQSFYVALRGSEGIVDIRQASGALHSAVRDLRDRYPRTPSLWAAYLHVGA